MRGLSRRAVHTFLEMNPTQIPDDEMQARRKRAVRTAMVVGGIALAIYVLFVLSGVVGR